MRRLMPLALGVGLVLNACSKKDSVSSSTSSTDSTTIKTELVTNYADILHAGYEDSYNTAVILQQKIESLIASPSQANLDSAKAAWIRARVPYQQTEMSRFYNGPVDGDTTGDVLINSWPLDEDYIDYLVADRHATTAYSTVNYTSGIINLPTKYPTSTITASYLQSINQPDGGTESPNQDNESVSCGYHAVEFLLWGQDDTAPVKALAGQRTYLDYVVGGTVPNADRRIVYLRATMTLLLKNLKEMTAAWAPGSSTNYRASFTATANIDASLKNILLGMGSLAKGELAGERLSVPLTLRVQEQEHSCFSDNTTYDLYYDMVGIQNAYLGTYTRVDGTKVSGTSVADYIKYRKAADNTQMTSLLSTAVTSMDAMNTAYKAGQHFDYLIAASNTSGNKIVQTAINSVGAVADYINQMSSDLNLNVVVPDENP